MVQTVRIEATPREGAGKGPARATRRAGKVPGVIYGAKQAEALIALDPRDVVKQLQTGGWQSHLYEVAVAGAGDGAAAEPVRALMREVQLHPVTDRPLHVDFQRLAPGARIRVRVPVRFLNEEASPGIKAGGVLNVVRRDVEVMADPDAVPEAFELDVGEAAIGDSLRWSAVKDAFGAQPVIARDFVVATMAPPTAAEEAAAAPAAPTAPEATKQKAPAAAAAPAAGGKGGGGGGKAAPAAKAPAKKK